MKTSIPIKIYKDIIDSYMSGFTLNKVGKLFNIAPNSVLNILERSNIPRRTHKYILDETVFDNITEESAYWVGFLMADGCVTNNNMLKLALSSIDKEHLNKLNMFFKSNYIIYDYDYSKKKYTIKKTKPWSALNITSTKIVNKIISYGVVPRKTHVAEVKNKDLLNSKDFWRGLVDGDGSIGIDNRGNPFFILYGTPMIIRQFKHYLIQNYFINIGIYKDSSTSCIIQARTSCNKAKNIIEILYKDSSIYLDRKMKIAINILNLILPRARNIKIGGYTI